MIRVKIRDIVAKDVIYLGEFDPCDLDDLALSFKKYGCYLGELDTTYYSARFVIDDDETYFEIIMEKAE